MFCASSKAYVSAVKAALRSHSRENAAEIFERAIDVLSPDFPDPTSIDEQTKEKEGRDGNELNLLKDRIAQIEKQLQEAQNERSTLESELESTKCSTLESELEFVKQEAQLNSSMKKNVQRLDTKVEILATETKDSIKEAAAAAAVTQPPTAPSASALSRPLKDIRQRNSFTACLSEDKPRIADVQLLPGGRLLLADGVNDCVRLFDTQLEVLFTNRQYSVRNRCQIPKWISIEREVRQACPISPLLFTVTGQHLRSLKCRNPPYCLAMLDSSSIRHAVALTLPGSPGIDLLEVTGDKIKVKETLLIRPGVAPLSGAVINHLLVFDLTQ
ncbi:hypothetical protein PoB_005481500 [Plakobranchus ocellatus]|uniref:Uncharacterized protein n=1 Tax=Plakobranchus ocellatus TaxID=259542 RepID=A0AAV4C9F4_9GAST|nr:hypothetical protein PoB_005481500 [Plakobranchus ocellatus]